MLVENVDYMFTFHPEKNDHYAIKILKGAYEGVEYEYTTISGREDKERIQAILSYNYNVLHDPANIIIDIKDFEKHIGDILNSIITGINLSDNPSDQMRLNEIPRNDNSTKLNSE